MNKDANIDAFLVDPAYQVTDKPLADYYTLPSDPSVLATMFPDMGLTGVVPPMQKYSDEDVKALSDYRDKIYYDKFLIPDQKLATIPSTYDYQLQPLKFVEKIQESFDKPNGMLMLGERRRWSLPVST